MTALARDASPSVKPPVAASGLQSGPGPPPRGTLDRGRSPAPGSVVPSAFANPRWCHLEGLIPRRPLGGVSHWQDVVTPIRGAVPVVLHSFLRLKSVPFPCRPRLVHLSAEGRPGGVSH